MKIQTIALLATLTIGLTAVPAQQAHAQAQASGLGKAHILGTTLQVEHRADLDFGQILADNSEQQAVKDPKHDDDVASFKVTGAPLSKVIVDVTAGDLTDDNGNTLPYNLDLAGHKFDHQTSAHQLVNPNTVQTNDSGEFYLWIGGDITVAADQAPGLYETTITVEAEYF